MNHRKRVFYIGMVTTDPYGEAVGEDTYAGAAERKMISIVRALRHVGQRALIVSLPFVGERGKKAIYGSVVTSTNGYPAVFITTLRSKHLRKIFGPIFLAGFVWRHVRTGDTVILYNHAVEYFLAVVLLRLRRIPVVQDIEDVPTPEEKGLRGALNRLGFAITFRITSSRKMVVAEHVARRLGLSDYVVIRGVASAEDDKTSPCAQNKWVALEGKAALTLHYGGTLRQDTGVDLFCAAVEALACNVDALARPVVFKVTGTGAFHKIRALQAKISASSRVRLDVQEELSKREYDALIESCHAGLSLRQPGASISNTTFPSKVIEITSRGLALISSDGGDVTNLFDDQSAFLMNSYEGAELAGIIADMTADPRRAEGVAAAGRMVCARNFSLQTIGEEMKRLL